MPDHAAIIEREWRAYVEDHDSPVLVELDKDAEEIRVTYRGHMFTCDCDSDEEFIFVSRTSSREVRFPIPPDYVA